MPQSIYGLPLFVTWAFTSFACTSCGSRSDVTTTTVSLDETVQLHMHVSLFDSSLHDMTACTGEDACVIDGTIAFGTLSAPPVEKVDAIILDVDGRRVELDGSHMFDPRSPREDRQLNVWMTRGRGDRLTIRGVFSDGAATYVGEWEVASKGSVRTILTCLECLALTVDSLNEQQ